jgi:NADH:ubiquinone oxidoreductase subunit 5 (subunit L)/multisubunit Na+/H+ antiporter MnhA subunit
MAMSLFGGKLEEGEDCKPWFKPVISLNNWVYNKYHWDNSGIATSGLAIALQNRLYIDKYYDLAMVKIVAGFSNKAAEADTKIIDGAVKQIEDKSQKLSTIVRSLTTGSARDYILWVAIGTLLIFFFIWGVA